MKVGHVSQRSDEYEGRKKREVAKGWETDMWNELNEKRGRNVGMPYLLQTDLTRRSAQPMFRVAGLVKTLVIPATDSLLLVIATIEAISVGCPQRTSS